MGGFNQLRKDKLLLSILIIVFILGIYVRLNNFSEVGYWGDDENTIPSGLLWFYPHSYFPGLAGQGEPPLGNLIIGYFCKLSGEDFSKVSEITPTYYPNRPALIGNALAKANSYCHLPMNIFGILFFIAVSILSLMLLNKYGALFSISFFSFYPVLLKYSRWIHIDVIMWFFLTLALIFLFKAYTAEKASKKELLYFSLTSLFLALTFASKLTAGLFILFSIFIILIKYSKDIFQFAIEKENSTKVELTTNLKRLITILILSSLIFTFFLLIFYNFNPKNLFDIYEKNRQFTNPTGSTISFNLNFLKTIFQSFLINLNIIDTLLLLFGIYIFFKLFRTKKTEKEKFILYLSILAIFPVLLFKTFSIDRLLFPYTIPMIFLMSLFFSKKPYSLFNKSKTHKKRKIFLAILIVYIVYSAQIAISDSPNFIKKDPVMCKVYSLNCELTYTSRSAKATAEYLSSVLKEDETFFPAGTPTTVYYYIRQEQGQQQFIMEQAFQKQIGRMPTLQELVTYFKPNNQTVRYILASPENTWFNIEAPLKERYVPNNIIKINNKESIWIYDLQNLKEK